MSHPKGSTIFGDNVPRASSKQMAAAKKRVKASEAGTKPYKKKSTMKKAAKKTMAAPKPAAKKAAPKKAAAKPAAKMTYGRGRNKSTPSAKAMATAKKAAPKKRRRMRGPKR